jgi:hypothetical protein
MQVGASIGSCLPRHTLTLYSFYTFLPGISLSFWRFIQILNKSLGNGKGLKECPF